ncbi:hypothetical protein GJ744_008307 [Endocarpon pusillum]|uniref:Uncharacterized protein n=1 Tax=Endocarpon pusillum TaxID=364733 RepID=A0A8H7A7I6_9EURO|nr:hypothetical protein GJ744_008307 [Endocarpon pusillum]
MTVWKNLFKKVNIRSVIAEISQQERDELVKENLNGHEVILRMILDVESVDLEAQDHRGRTALICAAELGYEKVVEMLLKEGAEVNAQGGAYGNVLHAVVSATFYFPLILQTAVKCSNFLIGPDLVFGR